MSTEIKPNQIIHPYVGMQVHALVKRRRARENGAEQEEEINTVYPGMILQLHGDNEVTVQIFSPNNSHLIRKAKFVATHHSITLTSEDVVTPLQVSQHKRG